jgi:hypothetical protein
MKKLFSVVAILSAAGCVYASDGGKIPNGFSFQGRIEANGSNENSERVTLITQLLQAYVEANLIIDTEELEAILAERRPISTESKDSSASEESKINEDKKSNK